MNDTPTTTPRNNEWGIISKEDGHWSSHKRRERWIKTVPLKTSAELETELTAVTEQRDRLAEACKALMKIVGEPNSTIDDCWVSEDEMDAAWNMGNEALAAVKGDNHES